LLWLLMVLPHFRLWLWLLLCLLLLGLLKVLPHIGLHLLLWLQLWWLLLHLLLMVLPQLRRLLLLWLLRRWLLNWLLRCSCDHANAGPCKDTNATINRGHTPAGDATSSSLLIMIT
jgi:hypothetical protein